MLTITPGSPLRGTVTLPGDKSISHRAALFAALAEGESRIENFLMAGVTKVMLDALTALGISWELEGTVLTVQGRGLSGLQSPVSPLYCGNSATTIRLLAGVLAAANLDAILDGSPGLRRRPMDRIVEPLREMGVDVEATDGKFAPLTFRKSQRISDSANQPTNRSTDQPINQPTNEPIPPPSSSPLPPRKSRPASSSPPSPPTIRSRSSNPAPRGITRKGCWQVWAWK